MKLIVTGTTGLVGYDLWHTLKEEHDVWGVGRKKPDFIPLTQWRTLDIIDADLTFRMITQINPDLVIHGAALSNPDDCADDPTTAYKANALGTRNIALACQKFDTEMLYISTDQVFNGIKKTPYNETDATAPVNHYGLTKLWGEQFVQNLLRRFYVVRTALVYGRQRPTFVDRVAQCAQSDEPVLAATDIVNSPTHSEDLSRAIAFLIKQHIYGTYHIVNEGHATRYDLAQFIAQSMGKKFNFIKKSKLSNLKFKAKRPGYTPLENLVWNLNGFPKIRTWQEALVSFLEELPD